MKRYLVCFLSLFLFSAAAFADAADVGQSLTVRTFQFKHKQADKATAVIKPLMSAEGTIAIQPAANSLVVTDTAENIKKIAAALAQFDAPAQPLKLSIRLVGATRGTADEAHVDPLLTDVASKLALLRYNVLEGLGGANYNGREGEPGLVELGDYRVDFRVGEYDPASDTVKLTDFKVARRDGDQLAPMLKTTLNLKFGQTLIFSAAKQPNSQRALMLVLIAQR